MKNQKMKFTAISKQTKGDGRIPKNPESPKNTKNGEMPKRIN